MGAVEPSWRRVGLAGPWAVLLWGTALYGLVITPAALAWMVDGLRAGLEPLIVWAVFGLCFAVPAGAALGGLAAGREHLLAGRPLVGWHLWVGHGLGLALIAHWIALLAWTPAALMRAAASSAQRGRFLESALAGLLPWMAVAVGIGLIGATAWAFRARTGAPVRSALPLPRIPHALASGAVAALLVGPGMLAAGAVVASAGDGGQLALPVALGLAGVGLVAGGALAWSGAAAEVLAARSGPEPVSWGRAFAGYLGAFLLAQWLTCLPMTLMPAWDHAVGQRFALQLVVIAGAALGAGLVGRRLAGLEVTPAAG